MKKFLLVFGILVAITLSLIVIGVDAQVVTPSMQDGQPVRVYMIQDVERDRWYMMKPPLGLVGWVPQQEAFVWTHKQHAEKARAALLGNRKTALRTFLLLPVQETP